MAVRQAASVSPAAPAQKFVAAAAEFAAAVVPRPLRAQEILTNFQLFSPENQLAETANLTAAQAAHLSRQTVYVDHDHDHDHDHGRAGFFFAAVGVSVWSVLLPARRSA